MNLKMWSAVWLIKKIEKNEDNLIKLKILFKNQMESLDEKQQRTVCIKAGYPELYEEFEN